MNEDIKCKSGIYQITNISTNKIYIGSSIDLHKREKQHFNDLKNNIHKNDHLQFSYNKYGKDNFIFEILEYVEDENNLIEREQYWLDKTQCYNNKIGYNMCPVAGNSLGYKHTDETKSKMSLNHADVNGKNNGFYGKKHTDETNRLNSEAHKGKIFTDEHKKKISVKVKGKNNPGAKLTESDVAKIRKLIDMNIKLIEIAKYFKVSSTTICDIKKERIWNDVELVNYFSKNELELFNNMERNKKLSDEQVKEIKRMLQKKIKQKDISEMFNIKRVTVSEIKNNKVYSYIKIDEITNEELKLINYNTGENNGMYGKHHTEETRRKIGKSSKLRVFSKESREKRSKALRGIGNGNAKLTESQVIEIKKLILQGLTLKEIAIKYKVTLGMISNIKNGYSWKHLYTEEDLKALRKESLLTDIQVNEIKELLKTNIKQVEIAKMYNVSPTIISCIKLNKIYKKVV